MGGQRRPRQASSEASAVARNLFTRAPNEVTVPDFGLFRDTLNRHFYPARVEPRNRFPVMREPRISAVHLPLTTIGYVHFGATASVDPGALPAYHVDIALDGTVAARCGDQYAVASAPVAVVFSPGRRTSLPQWDSDATQLSIKFERTRVEEELAGLLGRPVVKRIDFQLAFPLDGAAGGRWMSILSALLQSVDISQGSPHPRHVELLERSLISGLLISQIHSYSEELATNPGRRVPRSALDRVVDEVERAPDRGYSISDLARIAGTSARSLQCAFQDQYGISPMRYLRQVRLDRAHADLAEGTGSVADIASYWGFTNPGRFACAYRERFGELPSDTLNSHRVGPSRRARS